VLPPIAVRPFVFRLRDRPALVPNPEVAAAEWIDLALLASANARRDITLDHGGQRRRVAAWVTPIGDIWGMTERIVSLLLGR
nr:coenzyme A pyrophosphatase [Gemmatimonadales bacterium]